MSNPDWSLDSFLRNIAMGAVGCIELRDPNKTGGCPGDFHNYLGERIYLIDKYQASPHNKEMAARELDRLHEAIACELSRQGFPHSTHTVNRITQQAKAILASLNSARSAFGRM